MATAVVVTALADALAAHPGVPVAVDIPIGLIDDGPREADQAVRGLLRGAGARVFPAPPRRIITALAAGEVTDHAAASALARAHTGRGLSQQTWRICDKIAEVDALVAADAADLREVHPELAFARLADGTPLPRKRSYDGVRRRLDLLAAAGLEVPAGSAAGSAAIDDVLDATACAWVGLALADGAGAEPVPAQTRQRDHGRPVVMWTRG